DQQSRRAYEAFRAYETDLGRHIYLRALQDTNEILFYRLLLNHIEEMLPILYTPTVGQACQQFSHIYRRNRGLFVSYPHRDDIRTLLRNRPTGRWTSSWSRTGSGSSASAIKAPAAWASRSASSRCTPWWGASTPRERCRSSWTSAPTTRNGGTTQSTVPRSCAPELRPASGRRRIRSPLSADERK